MTPAEAIETLVARLRDLAEVRRVILFGSRVRGDNQPRSDIDLAVSLPDGTALDWQAVVEAADSVPTLLMIDLVRWEDAPPELKSRIVSEGKVLYER